MLTPPLILIHTPDRHGSKNTPVGPLDTEKIAEAVLLYVFTLPFPTSPLVLMCFAFYLALEV